MKYTTTKFISILLIAVFLFGCDETKTTTTQTSNGGEVVTQKRIFTQVRELTEFEYKNHTYISCNVRDGIALTHAGHCWCNNSKK